MHTIEIDDETYASLEVLAKKEHTSVSSVVKGALSRLPGLRKTAAPVKIPHGYRIPVSEGSRPFTSEDVYAAEDENDLRGLS
ncbi:ribbon-helix-helix protein, CopG family [Prosthecobacter sp.]|uniref:ribbon-helix-helix protein, CopG family n=1 Tax=Prosthecobacter sp. TaxID=1965333 RepID=UPI003784F144